MLIRSSRVRILLGASLFATLALLLAGLGVNGQAAGSASAHVHQQVNSGVNLVPAQKCATQPNHESLAYIEFCAPSFDDKVEGPQGIHVTLTGGNFNTLPTAIYLAKVGSPGALSQKGCQQPGGGCLTFDNGSDLKTLIDQTYGSGFTLSFRWTFSATDAPVGNAYALFAAETPDMSVPSTANFVVLSANPPCISAAPSGTPPDCSSASGPAKPLQVLEGQSIQVAGSGWLPGDKAQTIDVLLQCQSACQGTPIKVAQLKTSGEDQPTTGGALAAAAVTLPPKVVGTYLLIAENGDKSELFGDGASQAITLNIVAHPCIALGGSCMWSGADTPQSMTKAQSATIMLQNWKPGGRVNVYLVPGAQTTQGCKPTATLGKQQTLVPSNTGIGQAFTLPSSLQVGKTYTICATGQSTVGTDAVTAAMPVRIVKSVAHPLFSLLSLLALLLGLVSVAAYALTSRQRVAAPQPVTRR